MDADIEKKDTMVALMLPEEVASKIAVAGGVPVEDIHATLTFHGELENDAFQALVDDVRSAVANASPLSGTIGGIGTFPAQDSEKGQPWWVPLDVPGLNALHEDVREGTEGASSDHGYTPHITLTYAKDGDTPPSPVPSTEVTFDSVWVVRGNKEREQIPLGAGTSAEATGSDRLPADDANVELAEGHMLDIMDLAERAKSISDPALKRQAYARLLDLAVPSSQLTAEKRRQAASSGAAMADGSYPITDATSLASAIRLVGRSKEHSTAAVKAHIIKRARALGLTSQLPDEWNLAEDLAEFIDLALTKDGRKSFKKQGRWGHGFVPLDEKAKEAKAKGSPIAKKRINRLFGGAKRGMKSTKKDTGLPERIKVAKEGGGGSIVAKTAARLAGAKAPDTKTTQRVKNAQFEKNKVGRGTARAKQSWDKIPAEAKTVRNGKRYVVSSYGGRQVLTEWHGGATEQETENTTKYASLTSADAANLTTGELRKILKDPKMSKQARQVAYKALQVKIKAGAKRA